MIRGSAQPEGIGPHAEKDILYGLHAAGAARRFPAAFLVGLRRHHPNSFCRMVGRLPQRLVLGDKGSMSAHRDALAVATQFASHGAVLAAVVSLDGETTVGPANG